MLERVIYAQVLPNGDWTDRDHIDIWVDKSAVIDEVQLGKLVGTGIVQVFAPGLVTLFQRAKLKGGSKALGELAALEACHGICSECFPEFAARQRINNGSTTAGARAPDTAPAIRSTAKPDVTDFPNAKSLTNQEFARSVRTFLDFIVEHRNWGCDILITRQILGCGSRYMDKQIYRF